MVLTYIWFFFFRSATRMARPLTPPARPSITLDLPVTSDEEDWSSDDSMDTLREGSRSVLRVKRKHLRRKYDLHQELEDLDSSPKNRTNVHRTYSDGSRNLPANFKVENRSEVAERVVERYRRRAQSDVTSLEQVKHLFADNDIQINPKQITSNNKPRKLRPILQRSRETMALGDGPEKSLTPDSAQFQLQKKTLEPMTHLSIPKSEEDKDIYPSPPYSADNLKDHQVFFTKDLDVSPRSLKPIPSESNLENELMRKSPIHSRSCPDALVSS